jgi:phage-related minor tail protein
MTQTDPNTSNVEQKQSYGIEELQVVGEQLVSKVRELVHEGNVRRIIIKQEGHTILEIPLVVGVAGVLIAPVWAAIGVLGALLAKCSIEVIRSESPVEVTKEKVEELKNEFTSDVSR